MRFFSLPAASGAFGVPRPCSFFYERTDMRNQTHAHTRAHTHTCSLSIFHDREAEVLPVLWPWRHLHLHRDLWEKPPSTDTSELLECFRTFLAQKHRQWLVAPVTTAAGSDMTLLLLQGSTEEGPLAQFPASVKPAQSIQLTFRKLPLKGLILCWAK